MLTTVNTKAEKIISLAATTKVVLIVEYDGSRYHGFQLQANLPTIQDEIEKALWQLTGERLRVIAASRTDAGVHARGQVVSFRTQSPYALEVFIHGLNYYLPKDIAVQAAHRVSPSFNVRRQAVSREYNYYILNSLTRSPLRESFAYLVREPLDVEAMNQACQALVGEHDFASFASNLGIELKNTVRKVERAEVRRERDLVIFNMVANSYLPHQVRNTVGTLIRVGLGKISPQEFYGIIKARKSGQAGPTVPADGLYLMQVDYTQPLTEGIE